LSSKCECDPINLTTLLSLSQNNDIVSGNVISFDKQLRPCHFHWWCKLYGALWFLLFTQTDSNKIFTAGGRL